MHVAGIHCMACHTLPLLNRRDSCKAAKTLYHCLFSCHAPIGMPASLPIYKVVVMLSLNKSAKPMLQSSHELQIISASLMRWTAQTRWLPWAQLKRPQHSPQCPCISGLRQYLLDQQLAIRTNRNAWCTASTVWKVTARDVVQGQRIVMCCC